MARYCTILLFLAARLGAQDLTAQQVLDKVVQNYKTLAAVHLVADRETTAYPHGHAQVVFSECELAAKPGRHYFAHMTQSRQQAWMVSDGNTIWRALDTNRQWSQVSGATPSENDVENPDTKAHDLHDFLENALLYRMIALARAAKDPVLAKMQDFKVGHEKIRCYVVRAHSDIVDLELWVDQQRFIVLQSKEKGKVAEGQVEVSTKLKLAELDQQVSDGLFHYEPPAGWTEVEVLPLPGETYLTLTGGPAGDFNLKTIDGTPVTLAGLKGSVVVLDFWATWCGPCRAELPTMERLHSEFGAAVRFYGVNDEAPGTVKKFVESHHMEMPTLLDTNHQVNRGYGVHAIPALFVIGADGIVRSQFVGTRPESDLRKAIKGAMEQKN